MTIPANPMDLASLYAVKQWLGIQSTANDGNLQACLTAASIFFLRETGRGPRNWQNVTQSPFNEAVDYEEVYNGIAGQELFLRNFPVNSCSSLVVGGFTVTQSTGPLNPGYAVDDQGRSVVIRTGGAGQGYGFGRGYAGPYRVGGSWRPFASGIQSIQISYNAGFQAIPVVDQLNTIIPAWKPNVAYSTNDIVSDGIFLQQAQNSGTSGAVVPPWSSLQSGQTTDNAGPDQIVWVNTADVGAPNVIILKNDQATLSDGGVKFFSSGTALTKVSIAPAQGEYFLIANGVYLFNAADAGQSVLISYTSAGTPGDIILAVIQLVSLNYKRRDWIGVRSVAMKDVGSTSYTLEIDPGIRSVIRNYTRNNLSS